MNILCVVAFSMAAPVPAAAPPANAVNPDAIRDAVRVKVREDVALEFKRDGGRLREPARVKPAGATPAAVHVSLEVTTASPVAPPRKGATRPFLAVENNFEKTLHFRLLARTAGDKHFVEITEDVNPVPAGETFHKCWGFDTQFEEVVLFEFRLPDEPGK